MNDCGVVVIPIQRYSELLDIETRVDVAVERITHDACITTEDILWILGTELAISKVYEIKKKEEKEHKEYLKKYGEIEVEE